MLKVLIVDDETVVRRGIVLGMDWASMDCVVVGEATNGAQGLEAARRLKLDIHKCLVLEDSFNGIRAGHAAGAVTVMIPDMAQPTPEIEQLYTRRCNDLLEVRDLLLDGKL